MKKTYLIALLFFGIFAFGQEQAPIQKNEDKPEFKKIFSLGFSTGYKTFLGNNFLAETYNNRMPVCVDARFNFNGTFGAGLYYNFNNAAVKTTKFVGESTTANFKEWGFYLAYFAKINKDITVVPRIGISTFLMRNELYNEYYNAAYDYYTKGTSYFIAPEINYFLSPNFSLLLNIQYGFIYMPDVKASKAIGTNYNKSGELFIGAGFNIWL